MEGSVLLSTLNMNGENRNYPLLTVNIYVIKSGFLTNSIDQEGKAYISSYKISPLSAYNYLTRMISVSMASLKSKKVGNQNSN